MSELLPSNLTLSGHYEPDVDVLKKRILENAMTIAQLEAKVKSYEVALATVKTLEDRLRRDADNLWEDRKNLKKRISDAKAWLHAWEVKNESQLTVGIANHILGKIRSHLG